jgi:predicted small secreted protein
MTFKNVVVKLFAVAVLTSAVAACNTTEGAGKDIKSAGGAIEKTARDAKN